MVLTSCFPERLSSSHMNLQVLVALAEIVSALAVVLTLVVLIISIRQNTKSQKALVVDSLAAAITSINVPAMESPALGSALSKATADWSSASREERIIAHYFLFSLFKLLENAWYQQKTGVLDQAHWIGWESLLRKYYHSDGVRRVWWPSRKHAYSPEFQNFLSETTPPERLSSLGELFD